MKNLLQSKIIYNYRRDKVCSYRIVISDTAISIQLLPQVQFLIQRLLFITAELTKVTKTNTAVCTPLQIHSRRESWEQFYSLKLYQL